MTTMTTARAKLPRPYLVWLSGSLLSQLGDAAFFFALGWAATGHGGAAGGLVLTAVTLPRTLFLLIGGAVGDRISARRVLVFGDSAMLVIAATVAAVAVIAGSPLWLLVAAGLLVGTVDAFYIPSAGSMPRRLVPAEDIDRAVGLSQTGTQLISLVGSPFGAILVAAGGLAAAAAVDAGTFAFALIAVLLIRPLIPHESSITRSNVLKEAAEGVTFSARHPVLRPALLLTGAVAGFAIPVGSLLVPLLARSHGWSAQMTGVILAAQAIGALVVSAVVSRRGAARRAGHVASGSVLPMAAGICVLTISSAPALAFAGGVLFGVGLGLFVTHLGPLMLSASPVSHLSRVQSLITLVQSVALVVTLNLLGAVSDAVGATNAAFVCAGVLVAAGGGAFLAAGLRRPPSVS